MVKRADSENRGWQFESYKCHNKNNIVEEGNGTPPHKIYFFRKLRALSLVSAKLEIEYATQLNSGVPNDPGLELAA